MVRVSSRHEVRPPPTRSFMKGRAMSISKSSVPAILILAAFLGSAPLMAGDSAKPSDVTIINDAANPVPTLLLGTANVAGTVTLTGNPGVTVKNTAVNPVTVANRNEPAMQPFFAESFLTMSDGSCCSVRDENVYTVPAGKVLVLEHASGSSGVGSGQMAHFKVDAIRAEVGLTGAHVLSLTRKGASCASLSCDVWEFSQPLRMYVAAGDTLRFTFARTEPGHFATAELFLTGYLVDRP